jgi:hypothetical protein
VRLSAVDDLLILMNGVHQHHTHDLRSIRSRETANDEAAVGLPDEDVRRSDAQLAQGRVKFKAELCERPRARARFAPGVAPAVVAADAGERGDARLNECPDHREIAGPVLEEYGRGPVTRAVDVQTLSADVDELSGW